MSKILADYQYDLDDFKNLSGKLQGFNLPERIIEIINGIAQKVGAPEYQKTPVFSYKEREGRRPGKNKISNEDWEEMRNFKKTVLVKSEEPVDKIIDNITLSLNKITEGNFEAIKNEIVKLLNSTLEQKHSTEDLLKIGGSIFIIGSNNRFWAQLYARLYKILIETFPIMKNICKENFANFKKNFESIRYVSPDENYDLFCEINKENEARRGLSSFFVNLMNEKIVEVEHLGTIINELIIRFKTLLVLENKKEELEEIAENLFILMDSGSETLKVNWLDYNDSYNYLKKVTTFKKKEYPSLTNKTIFKFLDLK